MTRLTPAHAAAIARLRAYVPPPTNYYSLPLSRRAAVLILLYTDKRGQLRVVLTMRAKTLSSYAGQAALPGGKADSLDETPTQTARREANEEIGLPLIDSGLPRPFRIHHLCHLPLNLAATYLGVRPCVAWIEGDEEEEEEKEEEGEGGGSGRSSNTNTITNTNSNGNSSNAETRKGADSDTGRMLHVEDVLIPRLDAKEVAAVFTAPFESFLHVQDPAASHGQDAKQIDRTNPDDSTWYSGNVVDWNGQAWPTHNFYVPSSDQKVVWAERPATTVTMNRFRVWGMTARILIDAARIAFARNPEFIHHPQHGDENLIRRLIDEGHMKEKAKEKINGTKKAVTQKQDNSPRGKTNQFSKM